MWLTILVLSFVLFSITYTMLKVTEPEKKLAPPKPVQEGIGYTPIKNIGIIVVSKLLGL